MKIKTKHEDCPFCKNKIIDYKSAYNIIKKEFIEAVDYNEKMNEENKKLKSIILDIKSKVNIF